MNLVFKGPRGRSPTARDTYGTHIACVRTYVHSIDSTCIRALSRSGATLDVRVICGVGDSEHSPEPRTVEQGQGEVGRLGRAGTIESAGREEKLRASWEEA